jgi:type II restriction enzyme
MKITPKISKSGITKYDQAFSEFYATLRPSLKLWDYFVNWDKVYRNTKQIEIQLNLWNYLLGKSDFDSEFLELLKQHPEIVSAIPSLIVRDGSGSQAFAIVSDISDLTKPDLVFDFSHPANSEADRKLALQFFKQTGLIKLFTKDGVKNLVDYVIGVEAGLDSNGRKNRSGTSMETIVESYLKQFCLTHKLTYLPQATSSAIKSKWGFDVPVDKSSRRFDFAISNGKKLVLMEVNFYGGGGSKLKATAGEYKGLHNYLKDAGYEFVWITDGQGWESTKEPLGEAFEELDYIWNLNWLSRGYLEDLF